MKILAIDDQRLITFSVERKLTNHGYKVKTAADGLEGIKTFDLFNPDLVIVDYQMPKMNGVEVIEHLRNNGHTNLPILIMSGSIDEAVKEKGFELGIVDYLQKPFDLNKLVEVVEKIHTRARMAI